MSLSRVGRIRTSMLYLARTTYLSRRLQLTGSIGILLSCGGGLIGLPVWVIAVGGALCLVFLAAFGRMALSK